MVSWRKIKHKSRDLTGPPLITIFCRLQLRRVPFKRTYTMQATYYSTLLAFFHSLMFTVRNAFLVKSLSLTWFKLNFHSSAIYEILHIYFLRDDFSFLQFLKSNHCLVVTFPNTRVMKLSNFFSWKWLRSLKKFDEWSIKREFRNCTWLINENVIQSTWNRFGEKVDCITVLAI